MVCRVKDRLLSIFSIIWDVDNRRVICDTAVAMRAFLYRIKALSVSLFWALCDVGPGVKGMAGLCILGYLLQRGIESHSVSLLESWLNLQRGDILIVLKSQKTSLPMSLFALSAEGMRSGFWWQPVTYMFMHGSVLHLCLNMFMLVMFGSPVESRVGSWRFVRLYLFCGILGGAGWLLLGGFGGVDICLGASAGTFGVIGAYCGLYPKRLVALFGVVDIRARSLALLLGLAELLNVLYGTKNVAYSAHLAGGVAGYLAAVGFVRNWRIKWRFWQRKR